jgi:hypothetical protein
LGGRGATVHPGLVHVAESYHDCMPQRAYRQAGNGAARNGTEDLVRRSCGDGAGGRSPMPKSKSRKEESAETGSRPSSSSLKYCRYSRSSRLARRAPWRPRCCAGFMRWVLVCAIARHKPTTQQWSGGFRAGETPVSRAPSAADECRSSLEVPPSVETRCGPMRLSAAFPRCQGCPASKDHQRRVCRGQRQG